MVLMNTAIGKKGALHPSCCAQRPRRSGWRPGCRYDKTRAWLSRQGWPEVPHQQRKFSQTKSASNVRSARARYRWAHFKQIRTPSCQVCRSGLQCRADGNGNLLEPGPLICADRRCCAPVPLHHRGLYRRLQTSALLQAGRAAGTAIVALNLRCLAQLASSRGEGQVDLEPSVLDPVQGWALKHQHLLAQKYGLWDGVGDKQDCGPGLTARFPATPGSKVIACHLVQRAERLVHQKQFWLAHQGTGDGNALPHSP